MSKVNLIEVMTLVNLPASCLNRDEAQMPKECHFGGYDRARVSSQSQKFAIRQSESFKALCNEISASIRTAHIHEYIIPRLTGVPEGFEPAIIALCDTIGKGEVKGKIVWDEKADTYDFSKIDKKAPSYGKRSTQIMIYSQPQVDFLVETIQRFINEVNGDIVKFAAFTNAVRLMSTPRISLRRSLTVLKVFSSIPPKISMRAPMIILTISSVRAYVSRK